MEMYWIGTLKTKAKGERLKAKKWTFLAFYHPIW